MYCPECDRNIDDCEALTDRDGDPYDPATTFWSICPICLSILIDNQKIQQTKDR